MIDSANDNTNDTTNDTETEQARLDALHDAAIERDMHRTCSNCGYVHFQDAACAWECVRCGVWNDEDDERSIDDLP